MQIGHFCPRRPCYKSFTGADCRLLPTAGGGSRGELLRIAAQIHGEWVSLTGVSRGEDAAGQGHEQEMFSWN